MTVKDFLNKYDNEERFNEDELRDLYWGDLEEDDDDLVQQIEEEADEKRRWSQIITKILKINGRYFSVYGDIGLTEYQDDSFDIQPTEVMPVEKVVTITEWVEI